MDGTKRGIENERTFKCLKILRNNQRSLSVSVWKALGTESQEVVGILGTVLIKKKIFQD